MSKRGRNLALASEAASDISSRELSQHCFTKLNEEFVSLHVDSCVALLNRINDEGLYTPENDNKLRKLMNGEYRGLGELCTAQQGRDGTDAEGYIRTKKGEFREIEPIPDFFQSFARLYTTKSFVKFAIIIRFAMLFQLVRNWGSFTDIISKNERWCRRTSSPGSMEKFIKSIIAHSYPHVGDSRLDEVRILTDLHLLLLSRVTGGTIYFVGYFNAVFSKAISFDFHECKNIRFYVRKRPGDLYSVFLPNSIRAIYPEEFIIMPSFLNKNIFDSFHKREKLYNNEIRGDITGERIDNWTRTGFRPSKPLNRPLTSSLRSFRAAKASDLANRSPLLAVPRLVDSPLTLSSLFVPQSEENRDFLCHESKEMIIDLVTTGAFEFAGSFITRFREAHKDTGRKCVLYLRSIPRLKSARRKGPHETSLAYSLELLQSSLNFYAAILRCFNLDKHTMILRAALLSTIIDNLDALENLVTSCTFGQIDGLKMKVVHYAMIISAVDEDVRQKLEPFCSSTRLALSHYIPDFLYFLVSMVFEVPFVRLQQYSVDTSSMTAFDPDILDRTPIIVRNNTPTKENDPSFSAFNLRSGLPIPGLYVVDPVFLHNKKRTSPPFPKEIRYELFRRQLVTTITSVQSNSTQHTMSSQSSGPQSSTGSVQSSKRPVPSSAFTPMSTQRSQASPLSKASRKDYSGVGSRQDDLSSIGTISNDSSLPTLSRKKFRRIERELRKYRKHTRGEPSHQIASPPSSGSSVVVNPVVDSDETEHDIEHGDWEVYSILDHSDTVREEFGGYTGRWYTVEFLEPDPESGGRWLWYCTAPDLENCAWMLELYNQWLKDKTEVEEAGGVFEDPLPTNDGVKSRRKRYKQVLTSPRVCYIQGVFGQHLQRLFADIESIGRYSTSVGFFGYRDSDGRYRYPVVSAIKLFRDFQLNIQNEIDYNTSEYALCGRVFGSLGKHNDRKVDDFFFSDKGVPKPESFRVTHKCFMREIGKVTVLGKIAVFLVAIPHENISGPSHAALGIRFNKNTTLLYFPEQECNYDYQGRIIRVFQSSPKDSQVLFSFGDQADTMDCFQRVLSILAAILDGLPLSVLWPELSKMIKNQAKSY